MLVEMQLFAAGLPVAAGGKGGKVGIGQGVPVLGKDLPGRKAAGSFFAPIPQGQEVVIVIGEALDKAAIEASLKG